MTQEICNKRYNCKNVNSDTCDVFANQFGCKHYKKNMKSKSELQKAYDILIEENNRLREIIRRRT
jgi:hypothetical protein